MEKRKGITLVDLIVTIFLISFLLIIFIPINRKFKKIDMRCACGTRLKGLGTAMSVYSVDYKDNYPQLPGTGTWSKELGFDYFLENPDFNPGGDQYTTPRTITASWYLLVREADVDPNSFICHMQEAITKFDGSNPLKRDITALWDFGYEPHKHVSYVMHNPYGKYPSDGRRSAAFVVAGEMSPYFENGDILKKPKETVLQKRKDTSSPFLNQLYNSFYHDTEGQDVLYADGHNRVVSIIFRTFFYKLSIWSLFLLPSPLKG